MIEIIETDLEKINLDISKLRNSRILITGSSGLLGIYILSFLKKYKNDLNLELHVWNKNEIEIPFSEIFDNTVIIRGDITELKMFEGLPEYDLIIHAAGYGQPLRFLEDKIKTIEINTFSTIQLFKKLKKEGRFLFVSTSEIYSGNNTFEISENQIGTTNTDHPRSCYIEGKRSGESICYAYKELGYDVKIARLCLAYGPGTRKNDKRVLNSLIEKSIKYDSINLLDSGNAIRTYCYITDVIEMILNISLFGKETVYNIGGVSKTSILELAQKISDITKKSVVTSETDSIIQGNPNVVNVSIKKYCTEFKKLSFVQLEEGLNNTINWQKNLYNNEKSQN